MRRRSWSRPVEGRTGWPDITLPGFSKRCPPAEREDRHFIGDEPCSMDQQAPDRRCPPRALDWAFSPDGNSMMAGGNWSTVRYHSGFICRWSASAGDGWNMHWLAVSAWDPSLRMRLMAARAIVLLYTSRGDDTRRNAGGLEPACSELARQLDDVRYSLRALWGLWALRTECRTDSRSFEPCQTFSVISRWRSQQSRRSWRPGDRISWRDIALSRRSRGGPRGIFERSFGQTWVRPAMGANAIHFQYDQSLAARCPTCRRICGCGGLPDARRCGLLEALWDDAGRHGSRFVAFASY